MSVYGHWIFILIKKGSIITWYACHLTGPKQMQIINYTSCLFLCFNDSIKCIFCWLVTQQTVYLFCVYSPLGAHIQVNIQVKYKAQAALLNPRLSYSSLQIHLLLVCLYGVIRPTREFFTHMETSSEPVKGFKFWPLGTHGHWATRVLYAAMLGLP